MKPYAFKQVLSVVCSIPAESVSFDVYQAVSGGPPGVDGRGRCRGGVDLSRDERRRCGVVWVEWVGGAVVWVGGGCHAGVARGVAIDWCWGLGFNEGWGGGVGVGGFCGGVGGAGPGAPSRPVASVLCGIPCFAPTLLL